MRNRRAYRILGAAFLFALVGIAFFGAYHGARPTSSQDMNPSTFLTFSPGNTS